MLVSPFLYTVIYGLSLPMGPFQPQMWPFYSRETPHPLVVGEKAGNDLRRLLQTHFYTSRSGPPPQVRHSTDSRSATAMPLNHITLST